jgi:hypothetical protein
MLMAKTASLNATIWPYAGTSLDETQPAEVVYPARDVASFFWTPKPVDGVLATLISGTRAQALATLDEPMHTSGLARLLGRSLGNSPITSARFTTPASSIERATDDTSCIRARRSEMPSWTALNVPREGSPHESGSVAWPRVQGLLFVGLDRSRHRRLSCEPQSLARLFRNAAGWPGSTRPIAQHGHEQSGGHDVGERAQR